MSTLAKEISARGIRRLCHFTPSRNLAYILAGKEGILATQHLKSSERAVLNATDLERFDGHPDHVCCTIEYPNDWYFQKARKGEVLFLDWAVLLLDAQLLLEEGVKFSPRNAAAGGGRHLREGVEGFKALYESSVTGAYGKKFTRTATRPAAVPTDEQAEVLIPDRVPLSKVHAVAVRDEEQAKLEIERLRVLGISHPPIVIQPMFYDPQTLSKAIAAGKVPADTKFKQDDGG